MGIFKLKRGTEANRTTITPAAGELITTTDQQRLYIGDGVTAGGKSVGGGIDSGGVIAVGTGTVPDGYLECDGSAISRTTYSDLFAIIGTSFGVGDGSTTFTLPDLRGEFIRGWDNSRGIDVARTLGSFQLDEFKSHSHLAKAQGAGQFNGVAATNGSYSTAPTQSTGGVETRPRNVSMMYIIKY